MNSLDKFLAIICVLVVLGLTILTIIAVGRSCAPGNRDMDKLPHVNTPR